ncbi:MAG: tetratricopeptide repeat protein, partial [Vulcanimicrobiota bacterium]
MAAVNEALIMNENFAKAKVLKARMLLKNGNVKDASEIVQELLKSDPLDRDALELEEKIKPLLEKEKAETEENMETDKEKSEDVSSSEEKTKDGKETVPEDSTEIDVESTEKKE